MHHVSLPCQPFKHYDRIPQTNTDELWVKPSVRHSFFQTLSSEIHSPNDAVTFFFKTLLDLATLFNITVTLSV